MSTSSCNLLRFCTNVAASARTKENWNIPRLLFGEQLVTSTATWLELGGSGIWKNRNLWPELYLALLAIKNCCPAPQIFINHGHFVRIVRRVSFNTLQLRCPPEAFQHRSQSGPPSNRPRRAAILDTAF